MFKIENGGYHLVIDGGYFHNLVRYGNAKKYDNIEEATRGFFGDFIETLGIKLDELYGYGIKVDSITYTADGDNHIKLRKDIYPNYKAGRIKGVDEVKRKENAAFKNEHKKILTKQPYHIIEGIPFFYFSNCEADDIVADIVTMKLIGKKSIIFSSDKDLFQLIKNNTLVYNNVDLIDLDGFITKYQCRPNEFLLARCLSGDASDGIDGAKSVGLSTAIKSITNTFIETKKDGTKNDKQKSIDEFKKNGLLARNYNLMKLPFKQTEIVTEKVYYDEVKNNSGEIDVKCISSFIEEQKKVFLNACFKHNLKVK